MSATPVRPVAFFLLAFPLAVFFAGCSSHSPAAPPVPPPAEAFEAGITAYEQGHYGQAATLFASVNTPQANVLLGQSLTRDAAKKAAKAYDEALRADPKLDDAMEAMGLLLADQGDTAQAKSWLIKAGTSGGLSPEALVRLGDLYLVEGDCREALTAYEKAASPQVGSPLATRRLEAVRGLCGAKGLPQGAGKAARNGAEQEAGNAAQAGKNAKGPAGKTSAAPKPGPRTIDPNDI